METVTGLDALAERIARGESASADDAELILNARDLIAVGSLAGDMRRQLHGTKTTFLRVFEVHVDAVPDALPPRTVAGELRLVGRPSSVAQAAAAARAVFRLAANVPVAGFSLADLQALATNERRPFDEVVAALRDAGLEAISEVALDAGADTAAIETARGAGLRVERLTVHRLPPDARVATAMRARDLQALLGGFQAFAPLPRDVSPAAPTTGYEDIKQIAVARLVARNIPSIQVDWALYGPKLAQVALTMGADDVDGVAAVDPGLLGTRRSPLEEIRGNIKAAALDAIERSGRFVPASPGSGSVEAADR
jgi:aminodeoxyfutalosine synthase